MFPYLSIFTRAFCCNVNFYEHYFFFFTNFSRPIRFVLCSYAIGTRITKCKHIFFFFFIIITFGHLIKLLVRFRSRYVKRTKKKKQTFFRTVVRPRFSLCATIFLVNVTLSSFYFYRQSDPRPVKQHRSCQYVP